jgi:hypothetical protein
LYAERRAVQAPPVRDNALRGTWAAADPLPSDTAGKPTPPWAGAIETMEVFNNRRPAVYFLLRLELN